MEAKLIRHPRSFPLSGELWAHLRLCEQRKRKVAFGQSLYEVNETLSESQLQKSSSVETIVVKRKPRVPAKKPFVLPPEIAGPSLQQETKKPNSFEDHLSKLPYTRLHFGATIALQAVSSNEIVVVKNSCNSNRDGAVHSCPVDRYEQPDVSLFKLIELEDPRTYKAVHFGDDVWLQIFSGNGEPSWRNGSVVGAKVRQATHLPTVSLEARKPYHCCTDDEAKLLGMPTPVRATLPKGKEDAAWSFHEMRLRNQHALELGRWRIMPATEELAAAAARRGGYICNCDEIYLEQDFFYICFNQSGAELTFHKIPTGDGAGSNAGYRVERRGVWQIRIADPSANLQEMSKGEQRSELLMDRARKSLQNSGDCRHGKRKYPQRLPGWPRSYIAGGAAFAMELRECTKMQGAARESTALRVHADKEVDPHAYFGSRFNDVGPPVFTPFVDVDSSTFVTDSVSVATRGLQLASGSTLKSFVCSYGTPHRSKQDLLISRQTTTSELKFPPPSQQWKLGKHADGLAGASSCSRLSRGTERSKNYLAVDSDFSLASVSPAQERKSRLLGSAHSWPCVVARFSSPNSPIAGTLCARKTPRSAARPRHLRDREAPFAPKQRARPSRATRTKTPTPVVRRRRNAGAKTTQPSRRLVTSHRRRPPRRRLRPAATTTKTKTEALQRRSRSTSGTSGGCGVSRQRRVIRC